MRNVKEVKITAEGRDKGKVYLVREMPAAQAEDWACRAMEAVAGSGAMIPAEIMQAGLSGLYAIGLRAFLGAKHELTKPLLDEMWRDCVAYVPDPKKATVVRGAEIPGYPQPTGPMLQDDTEEVATRLQLRSEVFELHTGFSLAAFLSQQWKAAEEALATPPTTQT